MCSVPLRGRRAQGQRPRFADQCRSAYALVPGGPLVDLEEELGRRVDVAEESTLDPLIRDRGLHVAIFGLSGAPDWALAQRTVKDEFTFVTNNRADFIHLYRKMDLHAGLVVLVPNVVPNLQRALFQAALQYSATRDLINTVIEVRLEGKTVQCVEYQLPAA